MAETIMESPRFPDDISYGSSGGPSFNTDVISVNSGFEYRNQNWIQARHAYDVAFGIRSQEYLNDLKDFFQSMRGKALAFRYKDWGDYTSSGTDTISGSDQYLGEGTGSKTTYQIKKYYETGSFSTVRTINKIVAGSVKIEIDGVNEGDFTVDNNTGIITFIHGGIPAAGTSVWCGYEFDVPVRFDTDELNINLEMYEHGTVSVPLIEVRI